MFETTITTMIAMMIEFIKSIPDAFNKIEAHDYENHSYKELFYGDWSQYWYMTKDYKIMIQQNYYIHSEGDKVIYKEDMSFDTLSRIVSRYLKHIADEKDLAEWKKQHKEE